MDIPTTPELARLLENAMKHLTHDDVVERGGPSSPTITKLLAGQGEPISPVTAKKLERAFRWPAGTVAQVANGEHVALLDSVAAGGSRAVDIAADQIRPDLLHLTDYDLLSELRARMLLMATRLHEMGEQSLEVVVNEVDGNVITSRPRLPGAKDT